MYSILQTVIVSASFLKLMNFLKIDSGFGLLVDSVSQCLADCIPFTIFLSAWMGLFMLLYRIMGMGIAVGDYGSDKNILNNVAIYAIQTYRNTVGDDAPPTYPYWDAQDDYPIHQKFMMFIIWFTWLFNSFLGMLILLNFLIAILCTSFDDVQNKAV